MNGQEEAQIIQELSDLSKQGTWSGLRNLPQNYNIKSKPVATQKMTTREVDG